MWHTVQWSATSSNSSQCFRLMPRRVCSSYRKASTSSEVARILLRGEYSRLARGTWVEHTGLHLPQRRQSLTESAIAPMSLCCMISDSCPIRLKLGVQAWRRSAPGISLPALKWPLGSTRRLYSWNGASSASVRNSYLVRPMPCSPEITPSRSRAICMMRSTAWLASRSMP
ncbi:Uncharacterised protein [Bordetella pertussis]|nr:Uncharacterised protein [Bordetella pertussis]